MKIGRMRCIFILIGGLILWSQGFRTLSALSQTDENGSVNKQWTQWGEFYDESTRSQRNRDNFISFSHIRQGLRKPFSSTLSIETYLLLRYGKDLHRDFWNNRFEWGPGWRLRFSQKIFLAYYVEYILGTYLNIPDENPQLAQKKYNDIRTGLIFWYGWDKYRDPSWFSFCIDRWGELYSDISYYRKERDNIIGYAHLKSGIHMLRVWKTIFDAYAVVYINKDTKKDFWNNKLEIGPGIWLRPWEDLELQIYIEWLNGYYYGIEGIDPNPYSQKYQDRRMGILFWIGW
jgi:hypothetical protein